MTSDTLRVALLGLLEKWESSVLNAGDVHEAAEALMARWDWKECPRDQPLSIINEVLAQLDVLNQQLIIPDDIPAIRDFLSAPVGGEAQAWSSWESYWEAVDYEERARLLRGNPDYAI